MMKFARACLLVFIAVIVHAQETAPATPADLKAYLEQLQVTLDHAAQRANQPVADGSSVVGLRGAKQESGAKQLYWKDADGIPAVTPEEIKQFRAAVEQAQAGQKAEAVAALKAFEEKYPKSALLPDVRETLKRLP